MQMQCVCLSVDFSWAVVWEYHVLWNESRSNVDMQIERSYVTSHVLAIAMFAISVTFCEIFTGEMCMTLTLAFRMAIMMERALLVYEKLCLRNYSLFYESIWVGALKKFSVNILSLGRFPPFWISKWPFLQYGNYHHIHYFTWDNDVW